MADFNKIIQDIKKLYGVSGDTKSEDNKLRETLNTLNNQSSGGSKTTQSGSAITSTTLNQIVRKLGEANNATLSWNTSVMDVADSFGVLVSTIGNFGMGDGKSGIKDIIMALQNTVQPILDLDQALRTNVNRELGLTGDLSENIRMSIVQTAKETIKYGINVEDIANTYSNFVTTLGRAVPLSSELMENITKQARASGFAMDSAGAFLANLENYGLSIERGPKVLEEMSDTARSMGLTTNKFMSYAAENLKLINTLGFEKGVRGFTEIAAKASAVGFNLQTAASSAEKLFDIDSAIEMAAQLNVLGGDFGKLGSAIDLMFSPTNDMEGFTNELMKATTQFVSFNDEKNTFDVSPLDLRRAREFAKATGMSLEEVIETGKRMSKMELIKDRISFLPKLSEEERNLIGSLGQLNERGEVTIKGETVTKLMEEGRLTGAINSLKQQDAEGKRTQEDILSEQLNLMVQSNLYLKGLALQAGAFGEGGGLLTLLGDDLNKLARTALAGTGDKNISEVTNSLMTGIAEMFKNGNSKTFNEGFANAFDNADLDVKQKLMNIKSQIEEYTSMSIGAIPNKKPQGFSGQFGPLQEHQLQVENTFQPVIYIDGFNTAFNRDEVKAIDQHGNEYKLRVESGETKTNAVIGPKRQ